jgi:hypothetical protein
MNGSLLARLTDESLPRVFPLTKRDAVIILSRVYTRILYSHPAQDEYDAMSLWTTEQTLLQLRGDLHLQVFGLRI